MTVTLKTAHEEVSLSEAQPGRRIGRGWRDDLRNLNRSLIHEFAANGPRALAVLAVQAGVGANFASYVQLAAGTVGLWGGTGPRLNMHVYGVRVRVRLTVGGVSVGTASTGTSLSWGSMGSIALSGAALTADKMAALTLEVERTSTGSPAVYYVIVTEDLVPLAGLPGAGNIWTLFRAYHDEVFATADDPVDAYALQGLDGNARRLIFERSRRCSILYPMVGEAHQIVRLSSAHWRLDGPYMLEVPPHFSDTVTVAITIRRQNKPVLNFDVFALTQYDDFEAARVARTVTLTDDSTQRLTFKGLKARAGEQVMVWVAFRSEVGGSTWAKPDAYAWSVMAPHRLHIARNVDLEAAGTTPEGIPWGLCIVSRSEDTAASKDPTIKNALGFSTPTQVVDIASVQGLDNQTGGSTDPALLISISPNPSTGITRAPDFQAIMQTWNSVGSGNVSYQPVLDIRECAVAELLGVYIQAGGTVTPPRAKAAVPGRPPSAGLLTACADRANAMVYHGTSQCMIRHGGGRLSRPSATLTGGRVIYYSGSYLFVEGTAPGGDSYQVQVPLAPPDVSGGLACLTLYARFVLMGVLGDGLGYPETSDVLYRCRFVGRPWVTGSVKARKRITGGTQASPTEADAIVAMNAVSNQVGSSPQRSTANAYGQCYTWPVEGSHRQMAWEMGAVFSDDSQPSFPAILTAEIEPAGMGSYPSVSQLIIAGLSVWWGPREI